MMKYNDTVYHAIGVHMELSIKLHIIIQNIQWAAVQSKLKQRNNTASKGKKLKCGLLSTKEKMGSSL